MEIGRDLHGANEHTWDLRYISDVYLVFNFLGVGVWFFGSGSWQINFKVYLKCFKRI
jgi:hypothetical protein